MSPADALGTFSKFANPTVANGKVYVPTGAGQLVVYGTTAVGTPKAPAPFITSVVNGASYANGPLAAGEIVTIAGENLGPGTLATATPGPDGTLPSNFDAVQVLFNGIPGPILTTSSNAVSAIVPYEVSGAPAIAVQVVYNGQTSAEVDMPVTQADPGIFSADQSGSGQGAILNCDGSNNSPDNPAPAGAVVTLYATGGGPTQSWVDTAALVSEAIPLASAAQATVGGEPAQVLYAGTAVGKVAGTTQITLRLPADLPSGSQQIVVTIAGEQSPATTTVSIR